MVVKITGHHVDVTKALREYVESKMDRIVRHHDLLTDAHWILTVEKLDHKAEANLHVSGRSIHAEAVAEDMYAAIDGLADRLDRRVRKYKEKLNDHHAREAHRQRLA
jgi:putative sigma-54 modulation protein